MTPGTSPTRRRVLAAAGVFVLQRTAGAQQVKRRRIAFLGSGSPSVGAQYFGVFRQELFALGYGDEGIQIETRYADGQVQHLPDLAAELVRLAPEVLVASTPPGVYAAKQATSTVPIVGIAFGGPGLVTSLAHPGGNLTGLSLLVGPEIAGKWLELLKTAVPDAQRIAVLLNPGNAGHPDILGVSRQAAQTLRVKLLPLEARALDDIDNAFAVMTRERTEAVIVAPDPLFFTEARRIVAFAASHTLPAIYGFREAVVTGVV